MTAAAGIAQTEPGLPCVARAWQAHEHELLGYLMHRLGDAALAEDLLQEVFLRALRQGPGFCALDNARAWLFQVARNALADQFRAHRVHEPLSEMLAAPTPDPTQPGQAPVDRMADCIARVLPELAGEDAAILRACDLDGQTLKAYAQAQALTLPAAKSRLLRARMRLRERLVLVCQVRFDEDGSVCCHTPRTQPRAGLPD